jgi:hypothetical protein
VTSQAVHLTKPIAQPHGNTTGNTLYATSAKIYVQYNACVHQGTTQTAASHANGRHYLSQLQDVRMCSPREAVSQ